MSEAWEKDEEKQIWLTLDSGTFTASSAGWLGFYEFLEEYPQVSTTPTAPTVFALITTESAGVPVAVLSKTTEPAREKRLFVDCYRQTDSARGHFTKLCEELRTAFRTSTNTTGVAYLPNMSEAEYHGVEDAYIVERWWMPYWGGAE